MFVSAIQRSLLVLTLLVFFSGCTTLKIKTSPANESGLTNENGLNKTLPCKNCLPVEHIIMLNADGYPVDPTGTEGLCTDGNELNLCRGKHATIWPLTMASDYRPLPYEELDSQPNPPSYQRYLAKMFEKMDTYFKDPAHNCEKKQIMLFIHGGMNTQLGTLERVVDESGLDQALYKEIMQKGCHYPIFINWHSWLFSSYMDHLFRVRQGENWNFFGPITAPVYFVIDSLRSLSRAPMVWTSMTYNDYKSKNVPPLHYHFDKKEPLRMIRDSLPINDPGVRGEDCRLINTHNQKDQFHLSIGGPFYIEEIKPLKLLLDKIDCRKAGPNFKNALKGTKNLVSIPTKMLIAPLLDGIGTSAWNNMLRRVQLLFWTDMDYHDTSNNENGEQDNWNHHKASGGLSIFMQEFAQHLYNNNEVYKDIDISLVGHSMGSIILNEMIRTSAVVKIQPRMDRSIEPRDEDFSFRFKNIVYMGSASTINHFESTVLLYLQKNSEAKFYNLMLHRRAEVREDNVFDLSPRGSLLVWIDDFLSNPLTHRERTLGRIDNFLVAAHTIPKPLRGRIHIKSFREGMAESGSEENGWKSKTFPDPQEHGDFSSKFRFWLEDCWAAHVPSKNCNRISE